MVEIIELISSKTGVTGVHDILCQQNADLDLLLRILDDEKKPIDVTGYKGLIHVKPSASSTFSILEISSSPAASYAENRKITFGGIDGTVRIFVAAEKTRKLPVIKAVYDLVVVAPGGGTRRWMQGYFNIERGVTLKLV